MNVNLPDHPSYYKDIVNMVAKDDHVEYQFNNEVSAITFTKDLINGIECKYIRSGCIVKVYYFGEYSPSQIVAVLTSR